MCSWNIGGNGCRTSACFLVSFARDPKGLVYCIVLLIPTAANDLYFHINICSELPQCEFLNAHVSILGERGRGYTWPLGSHVTTDCVIKKKVCHIAGPHSPGVGLAI